MTKDNILSRINYRLQQLRERLEESRKYGINTPGFNQNLGAIDEMKSLREYILEGIVEI